MAEPCVSTFGPRFDRVTGEGATISDRHLARLHAWFKPAVAGWVIRREAGNSRELGAASVVERTDKAEYGCNDDRRRRQGLPEPQWRP